MNIHQVRAMRRNNVQRTQNAMPSFNVVAWHYEVSYENSYYPVCKRYDLTVKAYDEKHAIYKTCFHTFDGGIHHISATLSK